MPVPPIPPPIENLGNRPFSFYPPILNAGDCNEWNFRRATWSEILVANSKSGQEFWIPRRFLGEISRIEDPVVIVGLTKELEYSAGQIMPHIRRVIEMPRAVNDTIRPAVTEDTPKPAPVVGIRLESGAESRVGLLIGAVLVLGVLVCFLVISLFRTARDGSRIVYKPVVQSNLGMSADDDYYAVVRKLGIPADDHWRPGSGEMKYRLLSYPDRGVSVVLMGTEESKALYVGSFDTNWRVVDSVNLPGGKNTSSMLRALPRF